MALVMHLSLLAAFRATPLWAESTMSGLLARVAAGEQAAFKQCIDQYGGMIWGLARKLSAGAADTEDAAQDVFLHLWKNARHFDSTRGSEAIFIATLARRVLISRFRTRQRAPQAVSVEELGEASHWEPAVNDSQETHTEARMAAQALRTLSADQQRVIKLAVVNGLSHSEIATHTGLPLGTVKSLMRRGLIAVREKLGFAGTGGRP